MITTKTCSTCEHYPNDHHCAGCVWDEGKGENTKWELKINPIVIERAVLDKIRDEIEQNVSRYSISRERGCMGQVEWSDRLIKESEILKIIDKYRNEVNHETDN